MIKLLTLLIKLFLSLFKRKGKLSIINYKKEMKQYSKRKLIKEIIITSQDINHNQCGVESGFQKELRQYSKNRLIDTLTILKIYNKPKVRKFLRKNAIENLDPCRSVQ